MPRVAHRRYDCVPGCSVEATLAIIGGKWKGVILHHLGTADYLRFGDLRRRMPNVTQRMLTTQLRELEEDGLITRKIYAQVPPRVDYSLTDAGRLLSPLIAALGEWAKVNLDERGRPRFSQPLSAGETA
ncbi:MAG: helix-turn-helix domain-containing protein [Paracoccaceae bacterium]|jgi:DNA-binding HxlR family transcriptional regulator